MLEKLLPRTPAFFDEFDRHAAATVEGARHLLAMIEDYTNIIGKVTKIKEIEHEGDSITHRTMELLHSTFITPMDRDQIHTLASRMDDILDAIEAAAQEFVVYEIEKPTAEARDLARILLQATQEVQGAVTALRDLRRPQEILKRCIEVKSYENQGDAIHLAAVGRLFKEQKDPLIVMKWKEIYENLEAALDRCEDVANVIEGVVMESA